MQNNNAKEEEEKKEDSRPAIWRLTQSHQTNGLIELTKGKVQTSSIQALLMLPSLSLQTKNTSPPPFSNIL